VSAYILLLHTFLHPSFILLSVSLVPVRIRCSAISQKKQNKKNRLSPWFWNATHCAHYFRLSSMPYSSAPLPKFSFQYRPIAVAIKAETPQQKKQFKFKACNVYWPLQGPPTVYSSTWMWRSRVLPREGGGGIRGVPSRRESRGTQSTACLVGVSCKSGLWKHAWNYLACRSIPENCRIMRYRIYNCFERERLWRPGSALFKMKQHWILRSRDAFNKPTLQPRQAQHSVWLWAVHDLTMQEAKSIKRRRKKKRKFPF